MEKKFSFIRVKYLLQADWIAYRSSALRTIGILLIIWLFLLWQVLPPVSSGNFSFGFSYQAVFQAMFWGGGFVTLIAFCRLAGRKVFRSKGLFYTLPANNLEKYVSLLLEGLAYFLSFQFVYWFGLIVWKLIFPGSFDLPYSLMTIHVRELQDLHLFFYAAMFFLSALFFLAHLSIPKHPLLIGFAFIFLYMFVVGQVLKGILFYQNKLYAGGVKDDRLFTCGWALMLFLAAIWILYIAYLKLKERELR
ncbi:MAG: hypothetical protein LBL81_04920 [Tannerella sp.]|jgi:hypothetical protein|nr:hypothetical protein [Tannerella sp.]